jgi:hypothetical protein
MQYTYHGFVMITFHSKYSQTIPMFTSINTRVCTAPRVHPLLLKGLVMEGKQMTKEHLK